MIRKIVVPLDGSPESTAIIPFVRAILKRRRADVTLVQAVGWPFAESYGFIGPSLVSSAEKDLADARRSLGDLDGRRVGVVARFGIPARVVLQVASQEEASLIAMTTRSDAGWSRVLFGSVTEEVVRRSRPPVLVVPVASRAPSAGTSVLEERGLRRILLPYDDSNAAMDILQPVIEMAQLFDAEVVLLSMPREEVAPNWRKVETEIDLAALLRKRDVRTRTLEGTRLAPEEIESAAWANEADLIALALQNPAWTSRVAHSAFVRKLLRRTRRPLLVIRDRRSTRVEEVSPLRVRTAG